MIFVRFQGFSEMQTRTRGRVCTITIIETEMHKQVCGKINFFIPSAQRQPLFRFLLRFLMIVRCSDFNHDWRNDLGARSEKREARSETFSNVFLRKRR